MSTEKIGLLLEGLLEEQFSDEEAASVADAYFAKRAELKGSQPSEQQPLTVLERIALMEVRLKRIEAHLGLE